MAEAADIAWYGGTMLETSVGSAASAQVFSTLGPKNHGCELFGPQLLVDDIVTELMPIVDFELQRPTAPASASRSTGQARAVPDRARAGLTATHIDLGHKLAA